MGPFPSPNSFSTPPPHLGTLEDESDDNDEHLLSIYYVQSILWAVSFTAP